MEDFPGGPMVKNLPANAGESEASGWSEEFGSRSGNGKTVLGQ